MADREREVYHTTNTSGGGGMGAMGAILGVILGVLVVGGLIFLFASDWDRGSDTQLTINPPTTSGSETTGAGSSSAPSAPARSSAPSGSAQ